MLLKLTDILTFFFFGIKTNHPAVLISKRVIIRSIYRLKNTNDIDFALKRLPAHWLLATVEVQKDSSTILFECICIICINGKHSFFSFLLCVLIFFHIYANNEDDKSKHHIHNTRHRENILVVVCIYKILLSATFAGIVCSFIYISYHSARSSSREMMSLWRLTIMYITK